MNIIAKKRYVGQSIRVLESRLKENRNNLETLNYNVVTTYGLEGSHEFGRENIVILDIELSLYKSNISKSRPAVLQWSA